MVMKGCSGSGPEFAFGYAPVQDAAQDRCQTATGDGGLSAAFRMCCPIRVFGVDEGRKFGIPKRVGPGETDQRLECCAGLPVVECEFLHFWPDVRSCFLQYAPKKFLLSLEAVIDLSLVDPCAHFDHVDAHPLCLSRHQAGYGTGGHFRACPERSARKAGQADMPHRQMR